MVVGFAADVDVAEVASVDEGAFAVVEVVGAALVAACVEAGAAALVESGGVTLVSAGIKARIWMASRSPIGSRGDAQTGSSKAEATTARNNEWIAFFILTRSVGSAWTSNEKREWNERSRKSAATSCRKTTLPSLWVSL